MSNTTLELLKAWYIFTLSIGLYTGVHLAFLRRGNKHIHVTIIILLGLLLIAIGNAYLQIVQNVQNKTLQSLSQNLTWAYGPLLLMSVKHVLLKKTPSHIIALHFTPFVGVNAYYLAGAPVQTAGFYIYIALITQTTLYSILSLYIVKQHKQRFISVVKHHANTTYYWLLFLAAGLFALCIYDITLITLIRNGIPINMPLVYAVSGAICLYVCMITLFALYQPALFFKPLKTAYIEQEAATPPKIRNIELSQNAAQELNQKLNTLMQTHKPHLDDSLSLDKLASLLGVTRNQLSELLNVYNDMNFYEFINHRRFQEAINLLDNNTQFTIADIAFQAGFNNRNSFYKVFKEKTGITPSEFRRRQKQA